MEKVKRDGIVFHGLTIAAELIDNKSTFYWIGESMKVVYVFESANSALLLDRMIIPQLGRGEHGAEVVGMFFLAETVFFFLPEHPIGEALTVLASKLNFFIVCCDFCCGQRKISGRLYPGVQEGCFPDLYRLAAEHGAEQVITL